MSYWKLLDLEAHLCIIASICHPGIAESILLFVMYLWIEKNSRDLLKEKSEGLEAEA